MLIIGARGSGKTTLVETAISSLSSSHSSQFHVVRLNGLLQTDDKLALREIWRQLGVEMELDENDQPKSANFADTLQSILAILSHPDELQPNDEGPDVGGDPDPSRTATAVIFVLDEFDHFALHPRQTLLYNLFDIAQAKKAPIAVLGLTCKIDVVDSLEKRVKSRFSHRTVHLKLPATIDSFWEVVKEGLSADMGSEAALGNVNTERYFEAWNQHLSELRQAPVFASFLQHTFASSKTCAPIFNAFILPLSSLSVSSPFPSATTLTPLSPPQSNLHLLPSLSDLQLALLISAARLEVLADTETVNFEMVYDEYLKLCTKTRVQNTPSGGMGRVWSKSVAVGAWEGLEGMGLVIADAGGRRGMWRVDVGLMEMKEGTKGTQWARWCKEVL
ncbi:origin recognition complex subunit 4 C-terminus-domain-containing protein [Trichophaea hybrida]|nr:origin recognition complex subunit 4 C-terminus-domain-containing protein [Trichophaea hybrida]